MLNSSKANVQLEVQEMLIHKITEFESG